MRLLFRNPSFFNVYFSLCSLISPNERRDDRRGGRGGGRDGGGGFGSDESSWGGRGGAARGPGGFGGSGGYGARDTEFKSSERPSHLKLNLEPRSGGGMGMGASGSTSTASAGGEGDDKWSSVFKKGGGTSGMTFGQAGMGRGDSGDSRFAGKFGNSAPPGYSGSSGYSSSSRTSAETEAAWAQDPAEIAREEEAKAAKLAKKKEKEAAKKKEKAEREAAKAAEEAKKKEELEKTEKAKSIAKQVYSTGLKGDALVEHITGLSEKPTGSTLMREIFASYGDVNSLKWGADDEYGTALKFLIGTSVKEMVATLNEAQRYCHSIKFPKVEVKGNMKSLFERFFTLFYQRDIVSEDGFSGWADDDDDTVPGRVDAVVQTIAFLRVITKAIEVDEEEGEEEEEEDEIDAPRETA